MMKKGISENGFKRLARVFRAQEDVLDVENLPEGMVQIGEFAETLSPGMPNPPMKAWYVNDTGPEGKPEVVEINRLDALDIGYDKVSYAGLLDGRRISITYLFPFDGYKEPEFVKLRDDYGEFHNWVSFPE